MALIFVVIISVVYKLIPLSEKEFKIDDATIKKIGESWKLTMKGDINNNVQLKIKHSLLYPLDKYKILIREGHDNKILYYGDYKPSIDLNFDWTRSSLDFSLISENNESFYFSSGKGGYVTFDIVDKPIKKRSIEITLYSFLCKKYGTRYKMQIYVTKEEFEEFGWD